MPKTHKHVFLGGPNYEFWRGKRWACAVQSSGVFGQAERARTEVQHLMNLMCDSRTQKHHLSGLDQRSDSLAHLKTHLLNGICSHYGVDMLTANRNFHLSDEASTLDANDAADELVPTAYASKGCSPFAHDIAFGA